MKFLSLIAALSCSMASLSAGAANEDDTYLAHSYLRCAAFYVAGYKDVVKPELKQQLQNLANQSLYRAEQLMDKNRPLVKAEFEAAREKFAAELATDEVKADAQGFMNHTGRYCKALQEKGSTALPAK